MDPSISFPRSIAIAGAWGYIGRKFLDASLELGLETYVYDPGDAPVEVDLRRARRVYRESEFYELPADLFHLALHPGHRRKALRALGSRAEREPIFLLCEKPMAPPDQPAVCGQMVALARQPRITLLYDFPELYDPLTEQICRFLAEARDVRIASVWVERAKDREDPAIRRNEKRMVPIQYQETVHCLAFVLHVLGRVGGGLAPLFHSGLSVEATSEPYAAPNPEAYPYVVDGRCDYALTLGGIRIAGRTNFKRDAAWTKRRILRGTANGRPLTIDVEFFEGRKHLKINGVEQVSDAARNSYQDVIRTAGHWKSELSRERLIEGVYPHARFARVTYQLSSVLWRSSFDGRRLQLNSLDELLQFDARFASEIPRMPRYS